MGIPKLNEYRIPVEFRHRADREPERYSYPNLISWVRIGNDRGVQLDFDHSYKNPLFYVPHTYTSLGNRVDSLDWDVALVLWENL